VCSPRIGLGYECSKSAPCWSLRRVPFVNSILNGIEGSSHGSDAILWILLRWMPSQCLLGENRTSVERRPESTSRSAAVSVDGQIRDMRRPQLRSFNICLLEPDVGTAERTHRNSRPVLVARKTLPIDGGGRPKLGDCLPHSDEAWESSEESAPADYSPQVLVLYLERPAVRPCASARSHGGASDTAT